MGPENSQKQIWRVKNKASTSKHHYRGIIHFFDEPCCFRALSRLRCPLSSLLSPPPPFSDSNTKQHTETMSDRKAVVKNADMSEDMQQDAVDCATQALEKYNIEKDIAAYVKKVCSCGCACVVSWCECIVRCVVRWFVVSWFAKRSFSFSFLFLLWLTVSFSPFSFSPFSFSPFPFSPFSFSPFLL